MVQVTEFPQISVSSPVWRWDPEVPDTSWGLREVSGSSMSILGEAAEGDSLLSQILGPQPVGP